MRRYFDSFTRDISVPAERRRVNLLVAMSLLGVVTLLPFGGLAFRQGNAALAVADLAMALLLLANLRNAGRNRRFDRNIHIGLAAAGLLYLYLLVTGGIGGSAILWWYTYPLLTSFLLGSRRGAVVGIGMMVPAALYFGFAPAGEGWAHYPRDFQLRFLPSYGFVCALAFLFEYSRERTQEELRLAKEVAELASRTKSRFLASMSHELRTPLNAVIGFSEILAARYFGPLNEKQREYVDHIHAAGGHLLTLIGEVLDLSKVEAGRMEFERAEVDMAKLVEESLVMIRERAGARGIDIRLRLPDPPAGRAVGDALRIRQVLYNLLSNAVKFTAADGAVTVEVEEQGEQLVVSVSDTGIGISPEERGHLFEEFYQASAEAQDKTPGSGLGLALARHLVELQGGRIWAESEGRGRGSCFSFSIPKAAA